MRSSRSSSRASADKGHEEPALRVNPGMDRTEITVASARSGAVWSADPLYLSRVGGTGVAYARASARGGYC
jgi:hypothetical protein